MIGFTNYLQQNVCVQVTKKISYEKIKNNNLMYLDQIEINYIKQIAKKRSINKDERNKLHFESAMVFTFGFHTNL